MSLVLAADAKKFINTSLADEDLQAVIDRIESQITERIGAPQTDGYTTTVTKTLRGEGFCLYMPTEIYAVVSVTEDTNELTSDEYQTWAGGVIERLPVNCLAWGKRVTVVYKPVDDRKKRTQVILDLLRLTLERTAMKSESIAGEYSYTAPNDWDDEFRKAMKRLMFKAV